MKTLTMKEKSIARANSSNDYFLYFVFVVGLIFLGLVSLNTIVLSKPVIVGLGIITIAAVFLLALVDIGKLSLLFVIYLPFSRLLPGDFGTGTWALNLTNIFFVLMIIAILMEKMKANINIIPKSSLSIPIAIFCVINIISFFVSYQNIGYVYLEEFFTSLKQWLSPMLLFYVFLISVKDKDEIRRIVSLVVLITVCISFLLVFEYLRVRGAEDFDKMRVSGIFGQPNRAGAFFVYYGLILFAIFLNNLRSFKHWFLIFPILVQARALMYTFSRGAIAAFLFAILFMTFIRNKIIFILLIFSLVFVVLNPKLMPSALYERFSSTFLEEGQAAQGDVKDSLEPSAQRRITIWEGAILMIEEHPLFGIGYGLFPSTISSYASIHKVDSHNTYITLAAELGLVGLMVFLWIMLLILKNAWFVYRRTKDTFIKSFALGFLAGTVGLLVCNMFGTRLDSQEVTGLFWILTACIFKSKQIIIEEQKSKKNEKNKNTIRNR
ncbi:MAG: O-antigen ligase family protein [Candidatus Omnitrophota bacterium]